MKCNQVCVVTKTGLRDVWVLKIIGCSQARLVGSVVFVLISILNGSLVTLWPKHTS